MKKVMSGFLLSVLVFSMIGCSTGGSSTNSNGKDDLVIGTASLGPENFALRQHTTLLTPIVQERLFRLHYTDAYEAGKEKWGVQPNLCERAEMSSDGLTWDLFIRKGVQWQGGYGEFTAEDVAFSFEETADPENDGTGIWFFAPPEEGGFIKSWEVINPYQIRIQLSRLNSLFLTDLCDSAIHMFSKKYIEEVGWEAAKSKPIGTGTWELVSITPGDSIKFKRFDDYWDKSKISDFKTMTLKLAIDSASQMMMLKNGQIDMIQINAEQADEVKNSGFHIIEVPDVQVMTLCFGGQLLADDKKYDPTVPWANRSEEPLDSEWNQKALKVRQALCYAVDKDSIIKNIIYDYASPAVLREFPISHAWTLDSWKPYPYDPEKAKGLLAEAGYPDGFSRPIEILIDNVGTYGCDTPKVGNAIADYLEAIGLKVTRTVMDGNRIYETWKMNRDNAWRMMLDWGQVCPEPTWGWPWSRVSTAGEFVTANFHQSDEFINKALSTLDENERKKIVQDGGQWLYDNYTESALFSMSVLWAANDTIGDWSPRASYEMTLNFQQNLNGIQMKK